MSQKISRCELQARVRPRVFGENVRSYLLTKPHANRVTFKWHSTSGLEKSIKEEGKSGNRNVASPDCVSIRIYGASAMKWCLKQYLHAETLTACLWAPSITDHDNPSYEMTTFSPLLCTSQWVYGAKITFHRRWRHFSFGEDSLLGIDMHIGMIISCVYDIFWTS